MRHWQEYHLCVSIYTQTKHTRVNAWSKEARKNTTDRGRKTLEQSSFHYVSKGCMWWSVVYSCCTHVCKGNYKCGSEYWCELWQVVVCAHFSFQIYCRLCRSFCLCDMLCDRQCWQTAGNKMILWTKGNTCLLAQLQTGMTHSHTHLLTRSMKAFVSSMD